MHEAKYTEQIVEAIIRELGRYDGARPKKIKVLVGEMLHLDPEAVAFHYGVITKNASLQDVELELEEIPVKIHCRACGWEGHPEDHHLLQCEKCGSLEADLLNGQEIIIEKVEAEVKE
jgi:hydrogenase nickel incorporation protein HypA/HybF